VVVTVSVVVVAVVLAMVIVALPAVSVQDKTNTFCPYPALSEPIG
jgi:hypothetical protein